LLTLRWSDFDEKTSMLTIGGKVIRVPGEGLMRVDETKSAVGRTIPLPQFAVEMLQKRRHLPYLGEHDDEGLSARLGADHLGHSHVSMTQDRYMTRGRIHTHPTCSTAPSA
jgi:integrase